MLAGSTLFLCLGNSIALLVVGRLLQGFSAAIVWSVGCALLVDTVGDSIGVAMGYVNIAMIMGLLIAPVIGGAVYEAAGYYAVFYIAFAIVVVDIILRLFMIEKKVARQWELPVEDTPDVSAPQADAEALITTNLDEPNTIPTAPKSNDTSNDTTALAGSERRSLHENLDTDVSTPEAGSASQKWRKKDGILMLLKSPRLLVALYGIMVEAALM